MSKYNLLTDDDKKIIQPNDIKIDLMNHQKTMIYRMLEIELNGIIKVDNYTLENWRSIIGEMRGNGIINTNIAILGDKVGSGKTLMIITLITIKKLIPERDIEIAGNIFFSFKLKSSTPLVKTNLIITPHKIIFQWKESFNKYSPNISVLTINTNKEIDNLIHLLEVNQKNWKNENCIRIEEEIIPSKVEQYDVIIISETMYKRFYKASKNYKFNRILIDEADTIKLPKDLLNQFNFLWFITGTPTGLLNNNKSTIKKIIFNDHLEIQDNLVIKNEESYIDASITLPHPKRIKIKCLTPKELNIIKDLIPLSILHMINAGNSEQAIKALNCNIDTNENILQIVTKNLQDSISNLKIEIEAENKKHYPIYLQKDQQKKIIMLENQLVKSVNKYDNIKNRIYQLNDTTCPVCMGEFTNPVLVDCCNNTFCFDCLAVSLGELKNNKCPHCRQLINQKQIHVFSSDPVKKKEITNKSNKYDIKDKLDVLVDIVQNKPDGSFMIFAGYIETFSKIESKLKKLYIPYHILKGQSSVVKKHINDFKEKKVRILMLNAQFFGAGMNLQMATDIIMYHRFTNEMEEQIIGRAQRLGRSINEPLNVYYLLHDNESNNIQNNFKFEDQENINYIDWLEKNKKLENEDLENEELENKKLENEELENKKLENEDLKNEELENKKLENSDIINNNNNIITENYQNLINIDIKQEEFNNEDVINKFIVENNLMNSKIDKSNIIIINSDNEDNNIDFDNYQDFKVIT